MAMLEPSDIREDETVDDANVFGAQRDEDIVYPAQMAKLARICMSATLPFWRPR